MTISRITAAIALFLVAACSKAPAEPEAVTSGEWSVDSEASRLSYVSIKSGDIAEVNRFEEISGSVSANGEAEIEIDLSSIKTGVDIRDERMREIFFTVADYPTATVNAQINPEQFTDLEVGESEQTTLEAELSLKGVETEFEAAVSVTRVSADRVLVVSDAPVVLDANALELGDGLSQLQELAGLPSITPAVPVSFSIAFER